jgi:hypothetical protein
MLGVARRAAGQSYVVSDHRHDRMVCEAALARAVVIENVTKPKLTLLHESPEKYLLGRG